MNPPGLRRFLGKHPTSNIEHRTSNSQGSGERCIRCWTWDVRCPMFWLRLCLACRPPLYRRFPESKFWREVHKRDPVRCLLIGTKAMNNSAEPWLLERSMVSEALKRFVAEKVAQAHAARSDGKERSSKFDSLLHAAEKGDWPTM